MLIVLELIFDGSFDISDSDEDDQESSYLRDEVLDTEELAALFRDISSTQDVEHFVTPVDENEYEENS